MNAFSMMEISMLLILTAGLLIPSTHPDSQGAGQTLPVNSGKLLVESSERRPAFHRPR
jgi:hypothetical protein